MADAEPPSPSLPKPGVPGSSKPRRRWLWFLLLLLLVSAVAGFLLLSPPEKGSQITKTNAERLRKGMTQKEVEDILGCPPGDYVTREEVFFLATGILPGAPGF